jgi:hypothetical protein
MLPALTQLILTAVPFNAGTPARTTPSAACAAIVNPGPMLLFPALEFATELTTIILP